MQTLLLAATFFTATSIATSAELADDAEQVREAAIAHVLAGYQEFAEPRPYVPDDPIVRVTRDHPRVEPSVLAEPAAALGILAIGVVGWIGLGASACVCRAKSQAV
jgi:hypothetical protein